MSGSRNVSYPEGKDIELFQLSRRRGVERTYKCAGVLLQNVTVDIFDCATGPMIAGIVRAASRTTEQAGLGLRLRPASARVKTYSRNAFLREWGIVRSKTICSALLNT